jgi:hypothetical protein|tara:strand:- start:5956 stop:6411 length:456 start_codon:yes stop_codon:yes gene_type:complete
MNDDLKNDVYPLPDALIKQLKSNLSSITPTDKGYSRCKNLSSSGQLTHTQAKKLKHELENDMAESDYDVVGGDEMLHFIDDTLNHRRDNVHTTKKRKMESGLSNQFKKTHTKDTSKNPTKVRKVKVAKKADDIINNRAIYEEVAKIIKLIK